jgi:hypothetical protein
LIVPALVVVALLGLAGCASGRGVGGGDPDIESGQNVGGHPLYWVGKHFEKWDLEHVEVGVGEFASFTYGTCKIPAGDEGGCPPPLQIQIQPLCAHLREVAAAPIWKRRQVRGAPVGTIDSAPVLFTNRAQVKVYWGQGSDPGVPMRALRALRSANANKVGPEIDRDDPLPPAPRAILAGERPCA